MAPKLQKLEGAVRLASAQDQKDREREIAARMAESELVLSQTPPANYVSGQPSPPRAAVTQVSLNRDMPAQPTPVEPVIAQPSLQEPVLPQATPEQLGAGEGAPEVAQATPAQPIVSQPDVALVNLTQDTPVQSKPARSKPASGDPYAFTVVRPDYGPAPAEIAPTEKSGYGQRVRLSTYVPRELAQVIGWVCESEDKKESRVVAELLIEALKARGTVRADLKVRLS